MSREKRRFNAKLRNISKKEGTKKGKASSVNLIMSEKTVWTSNNMEEKRQTKRIKIEE